MDEYVIEVFQQTSDYSELRFSSSVGPAGVSGQPLTRGLDSAAINVLIGACQTAYEEESPARRMVSSAQLLQLGAQLFGFLDGDERWLSQTGVPADGAAVRITTSADRLRHLPWELLSRDGAFQAVAALGPLLPVRTVGVGGGRATSEVANRPLRVLFMATSPEGVEPELNFEAEEARILAATARTGVELVVEESGTLEGLRFTAESYGAGYFDVLHITGHAAVSQGRPVFLIEDELGGPATADPDEIAQALVGQWPRLVFVSGCLTGNAPGEGAIPSMSEALVRAGAPTVLGWALPVGDVSATQFAGHLYQGLAAGQRLDRAIVAARQQLFTDQHAAWHLLRVYADRSPLAAMVTHLNAPGREPSRTRHAAAEFLDPATRISRVAAREEFVGRRRVIQRCLRVLKRPLGTTSTANAVNADSAAQALILQGIGGLGKSTLASRLLERMPTHRRVVWFGQVDEIKLRELPDKVDFSGAEREQFKEASAILADDSLDPTARLRFLLSGPLERIPCLFVFDDFEKGNLDERSGGYVLAPDMARILPALLAAIEQTGSRSRVIITSRYRFPTPPGTSIHVESLETLTRLEQTKKIANLANLRPGARTDRAVRDRAVEAAAGNPRLLDWLNRIVDDPTLDIPALLGAIENEADRFREDILAERLLATQSEDLRTMLARLNVVELPMPAATVHAIHDHPDTEQHIRRAVDLGLLEEGTDPETGDPRYYVSNVLRPLIRPHLTDEDYTQACAAAAQSLFDLWVTTTP